MFLHKYFTCFKNSLHTFTNLIGCTNKVHTLRTGWRCVDRLFASIKPRVLCQLFPKYTFRHLPDAFTWRGVFFSRHVAFREKSTTFFAILSFLSVTICFSFDIIFEIMGKNIVLKLWGGGRLKSILLIWGGDSRKKGKKTIDWVIKWAF